MNTSMTPSQELILSDEAIIRELQNDSTVPPTVPLTDAEHVARLQEVLVLLADVTRLWQEVFDRCEASKHKTGA